MPIGPAVPPRAAIYSMPQMPAGMAVLLSLRCHWFAVPAVPLPIVKSMQSVFPLSRA